jgi:type II secretory pathway component PulF
MADEREINPSGCDGASTDRDAMQLFLWSAAETADSPRRAPVLRKIAARAAAGEPLALIVNDARLDIPRSLRSALRMNITSDDFPVVLAEFAEHEARLSGLRRDIASGLLYPSAIFALLLLVGGFVGSIVLPSLGEVVNDFDRGTVISSQSLWMTERLRMLLACIALAMLLVAGIVRLVGGAGRWRWLLGTIPLFGPLVRYFGAVELAGLLRIMLSRQVPLPAALLLVGRSAGDPNVADASRQLAEGICEGHSMSHLLGRSTRLPATMTPLVAWGEQQGTLPQSMTTIEHTFTEKIRMQTDWLLSILPPLIYVSCIFLVLCIVAPLISLMQIINNLW